MYGIALRVEFLKARARCERFTEDIRLIREEQRRTLVSLEHYAKAWEERGLTAHEPCNVIHQGLQAYAAKQTDIRRRLSNTFAVLWAKPLTSAHNMPVDDGKEAAEIHEPMPDGHDNSLKLSVLSDDDDDEHNTFQDVIDLDSD